ncbi:MAG: hypothetical protein WBF53_07165, partial [Litorimonas sp.]
GLDLQRVSANTAAVAANRVSIATNSGRIDQAFLRIAENSNGILANSAAIRDLESGLAAVAALPDMYLGRDESFAASGGAAVFGDEIGVGATLAIRGNDRWSFGASAAIGGDEATGKVQVRWAR